MVWRKVFCVTLGNPSDGAQIADATQPWELHCAADLKSAGKMLDDCPMPVGLLLLHQLDAPACDAIADFLKTRGSMQWIGVFPPEVFSQPACRELILQYLFDFHTWPIDALRLRHAVGHALGYARLNEPEVQEEPVLHMGFVGHSASIRHLRQQILKVASANAPVLIWGESGSGKELAAHAIHKNSIRSAGPFIAVNCGAIPENLIQSELFGYERGAFTGALREKRGLIESAAGGTVFLDEIGDLPMDLQTNLLRFLQEKTINRVGSTHSIEVDAHVIAASHVNLEKAVSAGLFREDLFYRLNVLLLDVPPLRERKEDLELLTRYFFKTFAQDKNPRLRGFSSKALQAINAYDWPGNVRELINRVRRAMVMADGRLITPQDLGLERRNGLRSGVALDDARIRAERNAIYVSLQRNGKNITHAAHELGVSRMTLYRLMEKLGIHPDADKASPVRKTL